MSSFDLEALETRRLAAGVTMSLNSNGSLVIQGTPGNDAISIMSTTTGITVQWASLKTVMARPALWDTAHYCLKTADLSSVGGKPVAIHWRPMKRVLVVGGGGDDAIAVDTTTQAVTQDMGVDSRVILLKNKRSYTDFASTALPGTYGTNAAWLKEFAVQKAAVEKAAAAGKYPGIVFLGDSLIKRFPSTGIAPWNKYFRTAMNLGMTGDTTSQILYRVNNGLLESLVAHPPKLLVLEIGTNNISLSDNAHSLYRGVRSILSAVRSRIPDTRILICSILPRRDVVGNAGAAAANAQLKTLDNGKAVRFLDTTDYFNSPKQMTHYLRSDNIHINVAGYAVWAELINTMIGQMLHGSHT